MGWVIAVMAVLLVVALAVVAWLWASRRDAERELAEARLGAEIDALVRERRRLRARGDAEAHRIAEIDEAIERAKVEAVAVRQDIESMTASQLAAAANEWLARRHARRQ